MKKLLLAAALAIASIAPAFAQQAGGFDSGSSAWQTATPNSSSHAAGSSVGGLFTVPVARFPGGSCVIQNLQWISTGGSTNPLLIRIWDVNPVNTTCTDQTAFAGSETDNRHLVPGGLISVTPAAPTSTTGDAFTYGDKTTLTVDYRNQDAVATKNVYVCVVTTTTDTADESKAVYLSLSGPQN